MVGLNNDVLTDMAQNLSVLIKHNVNIFDVDGIIVGSSDSSRLGEYHAFAHRVIKGEIKEFSVYDTAQKNVRPGINLAIYTNGKVIGAVGITGNPNEVKIFSEILKMSLETLIDRKLAEDKRVNTRKYEKQVVLDILFNLSGFKDIDKRLSVIGYKKKKYNILLKFYSEDVDFGKLFYGLNYLEADMNDKVTFIIGSDSISHLNHLKSDLFDKGIDVIVSETVTFDELKNEYKTIDYIELTTNNLPGTYLTKNYKLNSFLDQLDYSGYSRFTEAASIMSNQSLIDTFEAFIANDLSMVKTAKVLFVHLNTFKYRIKKIEELTGCSLKNVDDILKLKLSILSIKNKEGSM